MAYKLCNRSKGKQNEHVNYTYDAFVSYCAEDRFWVHDVLMKTLEEYYGFKLCIHYRDFPVGGDIPETIITSMEESRDIILVLSNMTVKSKWCQFEIDHALLREGQMKRRVIIISLVCECSLMFFFNFFEFKFPIIR